MAFALYITLLQKKIEMGAVFAEIELINNDDLAYARKGYIEDEDVKQMTVSMRVDTGTDMLCINESIQAQLGFPVMERRKAILADGRIIECDVVSSVEVRFKNRRTICNAMVMRGDNEPLLGCIPLEDMDVLIHPLRQELIVNPSHPYYAQMSLR